MIGTLLGGLKAARALRDYRASLSVDERHLRRRRDRLLSEDPTQRADARNLLNRLNSTLQQRLKRADQTATLTGGSADASAVERKAATEALASATSAIAADARRRNDRTDESYEQQRAELMRQRRQLIANQASSAIDAGAALDSSLLSGLIMW